MYGEVEDNGGKVTMERPDRKVEFLSYEVPTYFGLMCAAFRPSAE
ncbi:hypothetical protein [Alicyclobacillus herbarius]|nr:hypothetical protein [Alicyclobacillus herbarius]